MINNYHLNDIIQSLKFEWYASSKLSEFNSTDGLWKHKYVVIIPIKPGKINCKRKSE